MKLDVQQLERVAGLFRAFAEPTRLAIVQELKADEMSVSDIVDRLTTSQANVSKQLKILHDAGLVSAAASRGRRFSIGSRIRWSSSCAGSSATSSTAMPRGPRS